MDERERAYRGDEIVTILSTTGRGKHTKVTIRNGFGYEEVVSASELRRMDKDDPNKSYSFVPTQ